MSSILKLKVYKNRIEKLLHKYFPASREKLNKAMRYSLLNGGKRLRPLLVYGAGELVKAPLKKLDRAALAVECVHAYSLIHDDLPSMDNDDFRRGKPSCHKKFDEAEAILAGDALQSFAFEILSDNKNIEQIKLLAKSIGKSGMVLGQSQDIKHQQQKNKKISPKNARQKFYQINYLKTAELMSASLLLGLLCAENLSVYKNLNLYQKLNHFGKYFGLAFQLRDDELDQENYCTESGLGEENSAAFFFQKADNILLSIKKNHINTALLENIGEYICRPMP